MTCAVAMLWACHVRAQDAATSLTWIAPDECPSAAEARDALRALLGESSAARARVRIQPHDAGFRAEIAVQGAIAAERVLDGARCESLSEAALLVIAVLADPLAAAEHVSPAPPPRPKAAPEAELQLALSVRGDVGSLPQPSLGPGLQVGIQFGRLRAALEAGWWVPRVRLHGPRDGTGGEFGLWDAGLRASVAAVRSRGLDFGPSASFVVGSSSGSPVELHNGSSTTQHAPWGGVLVGAYLRQRESRLFVQLAADLGFLVFRPKYVIDDFGKVWSPSVWFGRVALSVGWSLS